MATTDLTGLSDEQLVHLELDLERQLIEKTFRHRTGQLEDTSSIKKVRREIARIRTAERTREAAQQLPKDALRNTYRGSFRPGQAAEGGEGAVQTGKSSGFLKGLAGRLGIGEKEGEESAQAE